MANVFTVEWTEKNQSVRQKVEFGNFDGGIAEAQRVIDDLWPAAFPDRKNVKVVSVFGGGNVQRVGVPDEGKK